ncbi:MAG: polysaccharide deacetylase family protein [Planctomycetes bacterium]|nr:polysaccharide deacetylase family protein [Planctomycetota bacterium]
MSEKTFPRKVCLKIDVDTHDGMRDGVPRLLAVLNEFGLVGTFFLSFGPDNSGKAIFNVFRQKGFLKKMMKTSAPSMYGLRTILSGTLLPARMIATKFPEIVKQIEAEGHEAEVHAYDHRLWQDHLPKMKFEKVREQLAKACEAYERILGKRPRATAAPAWMATRASLEIQDSLALDYCSDMRGGAPLMPAYDGYDATTMQIPTTNPCLEELFTAGTVSFADVQSGNSEAIDRSIDDILKVDDEIDVAVVALHAEVEGGPFVDFCRRLFAKIRDVGAETTPMIDYANELRAKGDVPRRKVGLRDLFGRAAPVLQING